MGVTKYFRIKEDETIPNTPSLLGQTSSIKKAESIDAKANIMHVQPNTKGINYVDLDRTLLLVSDAFKDVIKMYDKSYEFKAVALQEGKSSQQLYWKRGNAG